MLAVLREICDLIQKDIDDVIEVARQDLRLSLTPIPWWRRVFRKGKGPDLGCTGIATRRKFLVRREAF